MQLDFLKRRMDVWFSSISLMFAFSPLQISLVFGFSVFFVGWVGVFGQLGKLMDRAPFDKLGMVLDDLVLACLSQAQATLGWNWVLCLASGLGYDLLFGPI